MCVCVCVYTYYKKTPTVWVRHLALAVLHRIYKRSFVLWPVCVCKLALYVCMHSIFCATLRWCAFSEQQYEMCIQFRKRQLNLEREREGEWEQDRERKKDGKKRKSYAIYVCARSRVHTNVCHVESDGRGLTANGGRRRDRGSTRESRWVVLLTCILHKNEKVVFWMPQNVPP